MDVKIALVGATGNVGRKVSEMILHRKLTHPENLILFASSQSAGKQLNVQGINFTVQGLDVANFSNYNVFIFNTESDVSEKFIPTALEAGAYVIDSSSKYRLEPNVPLIIPPVNSKEINLHQKLYAHANCLASPIATVIDPLHRFKKISRINAVTYQSTSGAGKLASDECWDETKAIVSGKTYVRQVFQRQIALNVIPQVGAMMDEGMTFEEYKIIHEVKKVVDPMISITVTAVRVPVLIGHSIALSLEFSEAIELNEVIETLKKAPSVKLSNNHYSTPVEVIDNDDVFVGRIRRDLSVKHGIHLWLCSDNLRRGAATDSVEILEALLKQMQHPIMEGLQ